MSRRRFIESLIGPAGRIGAELHSVCQEYGVTREQIMAPARQCREISRARFALYYRLNERHGMSVTDIGRFLQKDHSTIAHGIRRHEELA